MSTTREHLATARANLRLAEDSFKVIKAQREQAIIEDAGGAKNLGANADERERALLLALAADQEYQEALSNYRLVQSTFDRLQAQLEDQIDQRRTEDRKSRDRLSAALEGLDLE